jgi:phospholipid-binding lipoprotein MlaA
MQVDKRWWGVVAGSLLGCAAVEAQDAHDEAIEPWERADATAPVNDPLEGVNRAVYRFNTEFDRYVAKPVAQGYDTVAPTPVKTGVSNFFANAYEPVVIVNEFLQGKFHHGMQGIARFAVNTLVGLGGVVDVASNMEDPLPRRKEDFGQTLAVWGVGEGPYLVLPLLGPSNLRDAVGLVPDWYAQPVNHIEDDGARWGLTVLDAVDARYRLLSAGAVVDEAALDPYAFVRSAYRQNRARLIEDQDAAPVPGAGDFGAH